MNLKNHEPIGYKKSSNSMIELLLFNILKQVFNLILFRRPCHQKTCTPTIESRYFA